MNKRDKETTKITLSLVILILFITSIFFLSKNIQLTYKNNESLINNLIGNKYYLYRYDKISQKYVIEQMEFLTSNQEFIYRYYDLKNNEGIFNNCNKYLYAKKDNEIKLLCENNIQTIDIINYEENSVTFKINDNLYTYYSSMEIAYNEMR